MTDRELMQQALDALEEAQDYTSCPTYSPSMTQQCAIAAVALRARLAQPDLITPADVKQLARIEKLVEDVDPYTAPPQREWQGLTDEELLDIADMAYANDLELLQTLQAKLKGKNT